MRMKTHIAEVIQKLANESGGFTVRTFTRKYPYGAKLLIMKNWNLSRAKPFFHLFCLFAILISATDAFAQTAKWRYVMSAASGKKVYLNDEIKNLPDRHKSVWEKMIETDGSFVIILAEWDCADKRRTPLQFSFYDSGGVLTNLRKLSPDWSELVPGSIAVASYARICLPARPVKGARIISPRTPLRLRPGNDSAIIRIAERGELFQIVPESGLGGWFNIVDPKTEQDYWLPKDWFDTIVIDQPSKKRSVAAAAVPAIVKKKPQKTNPKRKKS
jgi:hypothetical protein